MVHELRAAPSNARVRMGKSRDNGLDTCLPCACQDLRRLFDNAPISCAQSFYQALQRQFLRLLDVHLYPLSLKYASSRTLGMRSTVTSLPVYVSKVSRKLQ